MNGYAASVLHSGCYMCIDCMKKTRLEAHTATPIGAEQVCMPYELSGTLFAASWYASRAFLFICLHTPAAWLLPAEHSGKRTLARHLFALLSGYRRHAASSPSDRFPKFAKSVFVNLASGDSDSDSQEQHWLRSVLKQLGDLDAHAKLDTTTLQQRYKNAVQGHAVLLVLTNLTTPKQFGTLSAGLGSGSCVVVTSGSGLDQVLQMVSVSAFQPSVNVTYAVASSATLSSASAAATEHISPWNCLLAPHGADGLQAQPDY